MKCFRIENNEGNGPFTYTVSKAFTAMLLKAFNRAQHPPPTFIIDDAGYFAFRSMKDAYAWFDTAMLDELHAHGYVINEYRVKSFTGEDANQVQFRKEGAKLKNTYLLITG